MLNIPDRANTGAVAVPATGTTWELVDRMVGHILRTMKFIGGMVPSKRISALLLDIAWKVGITPQDLLEDQR